MDALREDWHVVKSLRQAVYWNLIFINTAMFV